MKNDKDGAISILVRQNPKGHLTPASRANDKKDKTMQATPSQVTTDSFDAAPVFFDDTYEDDLGGVILPALKKAASDAGRDHLLVRRRRRGGRRSAR